MMVSPETHSSSIAIDQIVNQAGLRMTHGMFDTTVSKIV